MAVAQQNVIFTHPNGVTVVEEPQSLVIEGNLEFAKVYNQYLNAMGAKVIETTATTMKWRASKSHAIEQLFEQILSVKIADSYTMKPQPLPSSAVAVAGMTFQQPLGARAGGASGPLAGASGPLAGASSPLAGASGPLAGASGPLAGASGPGASGLAPVQVAPFSAAVAGMEGAAAGGAYAPPQEKAPAKLVAGGEQVGWWLYDYSELSVAVFLGKLLYEQGYNKHLEKAGGKYSNRLRPDGSAGMTQTGWIFAKSNAGAMDFLDGLMGIKTRTLVDFSRVKQYRGRGDHGSAAVDAAPYVGHASGPQVVAGPFTVGAASIPSMGMPGPSFAGIVPGLPDASAVLSGDALLTKAFRDFANLVKADVGCGFVVGTPEHVAALVGDSPTAFELEIGSLKCVKLAKPE